ncbi:amphoterin-induced protein 3 [Notamacropus eugenii]|uniref:amphoterin-induced protein 3 n=1 Tax=Notamacropus eugenii TaxID=9315 RepID=UPI003B66BF8A
MASLISVCMLWLWLGKLPLPEAGTHSAPDNMSHVLHHCPKVCICASDLLSCSNRHLHVVPVPLPAMTTVLDLSYNVLPHLHPGWLAALPRLHILRLAHNQLRSLSRGTFHNASGLRRLDLSSNGLYVVGHHDFEGLTGLEELLLYNNHIGFVDHSAFRGLGRLSRLYLSCNRLTTFSFHDLHGLSPGQLRVLDLSTNRLASIPVNEVVTLPAFIKNGLYLHNNPIRCGCNLYHMLLRWRQRGFSSVCDYLEEHVCIAFDVPSSRVRFFTHSKVFENCSSPAPSLEQSDVHLEVQAGQPLLIHCDASAPAARYAWVSPSNELLVFPGNKDNTIRVMSNGSLSIKEAQPSHTGVFVCLAAGSRLHHNQTHEYNVTVRYPPHESESFNTGLTTLLGCVVSLILVLLYLFLTPCTCCCRCCRPVPLVPPQECSAQSSILSSTPPAADGPGRKASTHKHVVFLEPVKEGQNGRVKLAVSEDFDLRNPKILQVKSDSESISSMFSDTPIMS